MVIEVFKKKFLAEARQHRAETTVWLMLRGRGFANAKGSLNRSPWRTRSPQSPTSTLSPIRSCSVAFAAMATKIRRTHFEAFTTATAVEKIQRTDFAQFFEAIHEVQGSIDVVDHPCGNVHCGAFPWRFRPMAGPGNHANSRSPH